MNKTDFLACVFLALGFAVTNAAPPPIQQATDGMITLHARDVTIHGTMVRYEPATNKNTIGYWTKREDWVSWDFTVTKAGKFRVEVLQGCGKGSGGSEVAVTVERSKEAGAKPTQTLKFTVQDTGHFQNFITREIGQMELLVGRFMLSVKPQSKPGVAVMDLRQVTLKPVMD